MSRMQIAKVACRSPTATDDSFFLPYNPLSSPLETMNPPTGKTAPLSQIPANDLRSVRRRSPGALANGYVGPPSATAQHGPSLAANGTYGYAAANPASFGLQMAADGPLLAVSPVEAAGYAGGPRVPAGATATPLLDTQTFVRGASEHFGYHLDDVGHEGLFQDGSFVLGGWRDRLPAGLQGPAGASFESGPAAPPAAAPTSSGVRTGTVSANVAGGFTQQPLPASPRLAQGAPPAAPVPFVAASPLAPPTIDPMSLVYPELLPIFPYMASPEVASLARNPDVLPDDEMGDGRGRADAVPRKRVSKTKQNEMDFRGYADCWLRIPISAVQ